MSYPSIEEFLAQSHNGFNMTMVQLPRQKSDLERVDELESYIGISHGIVDPFNLFINITDITEGNELIYFFSYSIGKKRVVVWGTYDRYDDTISVESACRFDSWIWTTYPRLWQDLGYKIYTTITKNKFTSRINRFTRKPKAVNTEADYKAWNYLIAWYRGNINDDDLKLLFDRLDKEDLSYDYPFYKEGRSPSADFYDLFDITDLTEELDVLDIVEEAVNKLADYEAKRLNVIDNSAPENISNTVMHITELFMDYISRSKYVSPTQVASIPLCPRSSDECDEAQLEDENNKCALFTYGAHSFNHNDKRYGQYPVAYDLT
jgi:hypothetical protein